MKSSDKKLGLAIQLFLLQQGLQIDDLAQQMGIARDSLSNLIHGRRGFKDETLKKLANTPALKKGDLTLSRLRALRAMDEYSFEELILAMAEYIKLGEIERLPKGFFQRFRDVLEQERFPKALLNKKHALLALIQEDPL